MTLGEFRELTKELPDDYHLISSDNPVMGFHPTAFFGLSIYKGLMNQGYQYRDWFRGADMPKDWDDVNAVCLKEIRV